MKEVIDFINLINSIIFSSEFSINFFSNCFSDLLIAIVIGLFVNFWISRKMNEREKKEEERDQAAWEAIKALKLIQSLKIDVHTQGHYIDISINKLDEAKKEGYIYSPIINGEIPSINISFWEIYKNSGDLPKYLDIWPIRRTCDFYSSLEDVKHKNGLVWENRQSIVRMTEYANSSLDSLQRAKELYSEVCSFLGSEEDKKIQELSNINEFGSAYPQGPDFLIKGHILGRKKIPKG